MVCPYIQPGPRKSKLTEQDVVGVWLGFGVGAPKQFFIIKKVGGKLRGMACGSCDNPYTMAGRVPGFSLQGPVPIEATAGNVWSEWPPKNTSSPR